MRTTKLTGVCLLTSLLIAGCGYAKRSDVAAQMDQLRTEMQAGDAAVGQQVAAVSGRVDQNEQRLVALQRDLETLRNEYNVRIERLEGRMQGLLAFNVPVHFEFDRADVRSQDTQVLNRFAAVIKEHYPGSIITVEGFTDPAGSTDYNKRLGSARADAVKGYLVTQGLSNELLRTVSYGESRERLIVPNGVKDEGLPNRRVVIVVDMYAGAGRPVTDGQ
jgi:peptidoglycan-associated lipoprotein